MRQWIAFVADVHATIAIKATNAAGQNADVIELHMLAVPPTNTAAAMQTANTA